MNVCLIVFVKCYINFERIYSKLTLFCWKIINDWSFSLAALIAYYLLISLLPLILSMFAVVSLIFGSDAKFQSQIRDRLIKAFPEQGLTAVLDALLNSLSIVLLKSFRLKSIILFLLLSKLILLNI